ncbi:hypothetical protein K474DRAFT_648429 [Panus rudis PR-1116 ss-1]|nr:hypothetical protein K474DRAFT_648429 [Panus rudis PR-1116 ss-1]
MATVNWSNVVPTRRNGSFLLTQVPADVYRMVFDHLPCTTNVDLSTLKIDEIRQYKSDLRVLCLVCRLFYALCSAKLFQCVALDGRSRATDFKTYSTYKWYLKATEGDEAALIHMGHVKSITVASWESQRSDGTWLEPRCKLMLKQMLPACIHLNTLTFTATPVPGRIIETLFCLPHLRNLTFQSCRIGATAYPANHFTVPLKATFPPLEKLAIIRCTIAGIHCAAFVQLASESSSLKSLQVTNREIGLQILERNPNMQLLVLGIPIMANDAHAISKYLNNTPNLSNLTLSNADDEFIPPINLNLHPGALPVLEDLTCCPSLAIRLLITVVDH